MQRFLILMTFMGFFITADRASAAGHPAETIQRSEQVLSDLLTIPARQIPQHMLVGATGVAVIPDVTKIGFIAGVRRGHGVLMVLDAEGEWSLPQFITLTGGSVGGQAGIQGTDVVLIFKTRRGVEGLMKGKFTIGVDASVSAGPLGRDAEAATDTVLKAEILSYSRSRGLFLGVALDGSVLEIDHLAHLEYYGSTSSELPRHIPDSATRYREHLVELTHSHTAPPHASGHTAVSPRKLEILRHSLAHHAGQLQAVLNPAWRNYLALPVETLDPLAPHNLVSLTALEQRFNKIATTPIYHDLAEHPEFRLTHELLREYIQALPLVGPISHIPPPPIR